MCLGNFRFSALTGTSLTVKIIICTKNTIVMPFRKPDRPLDRPAPEAVEGGAQKRRCRRLQPLLRGKPGPLVPPGPGLRQGIAEKTGDGVSVFGDVDQGGEDGESQLESPEQPPTEGQGPEKDQPLLPAVQALPPVGQGIEQAGETSRLRRCGRSGNHNRQDQSQEGEGSDDRQHLLPVPVQPP